MKKRSKDFHSSKKLLYTSLIVLGILLIVCAGVYALTPGVAPNPGHLISEFSPPSPCVAGQFLQWNGATWVCANLT